ncbi:aminotransferase class I/II-fold pyridoxal phosphate-dependent enzyme [Tropicimonas sp. TH_r6]|uniref:pyridoxal phosphate-dependent aminotransferase n=1 Tax=Tropicimonas sp. TH_r6 TaxID=3082085 RepID=UPI00295459C9|nr:aminotransferase class I/II-fold pyridoxal phosphate-dependent enzyme [Tropicimonas sp. TH_r6]MDV7141397.1 aminotransferase class I/II-fold pyridoxal phosphate-dependent enzyme [Tropicimonas sp. TH_r6]
MRYAPITDRLTGLGSAKWDVHIRAKDLLAQGRDIIELTIGEPDVPTPKALVETAINALRQGRTGYSNGRGEADLLDALAARYTARCGRAIGPDQILCFPGTQTTLYAVMAALSAAGDEVLVGDPLYATYEGVIASTGALAVAVPLRPERGFRIAAEDIAARVTPRSRVIFLNTPHNPSGAVLTRADLIEIGAVAKAHDLWILSDEVYEELVFDDVEFVSPLDIPELAERTVVATSISKSHAAPGFRSGWCIGSAEFAQRLLPVAETMLFGNQPFIADMTAKAVAAPSEVAAGMRARLARRADFLVERFADVPEIRVHRPQAGMFALLDVSALGLSSLNYAFELLEETGVAVMPGCSFGTGLPGWVRLALTVTDADLERACDRILTHAARRSSGGCAA